MPRALAMIALAATTGCLITNPVDPNPEPPLTPPVIQDIAGLTRPRIGDLQTVVRNLGAPAVVTFLIPVDDDGVNDQLQYQFIVDGVRDCVELDGGMDCQPPDGLRVILPNGQRRRIISHTLRFNDPDTACHRVELWVSSGFQRGGNYHTPVRPGDVAFATWWFIVRPPPEMQTPAPVSCQSVLP